jgi:transposase
MAKSYGDDLRRKLLQAHDRGEGTLEQLAQRFSVSAPWAWKISAQRKRNGQMERVEQRRGGNRKVTAAVEQRLLGWVQAQPDLTLAELQQKLRVCDETWVLRHTSAYHSTGYSLPNLERQKTAAVSNRSDVGVVFRRSSCLWFQLFSVETCSFLPDD